ncbi:type I restriction enzyme, S subunit [Algoriphagus alkaliphilus]|uniref:Type I restriction enzyme, S subunit n=1 Tax=Algoriphagus alkaliphilus TaxID=279824 RepID=A0A1G5ZLG7_9BACT|nr:restriction endonuclease subunit S [Algoriphagus alkaliphilus]SDA95367.1 type I restriction enzyme, S subunit [Algoriphagus alkaliphilus]
MEYGDILFQRSSETREEVGQANVYLDKTRPATFGGFVIRGKKVGVYDPSFLNYLLKTPRSRNEITSKSGGSTRYNVGQETLSQVPVILPILTEQQKIAEFLTAVDRRIELLQAKKEKLEAYKKGVMQQIFSQKLRFKADDGSDFPDWEERKLGEVAKFLKGKGISKADITPYGDLECVRYGELYTDYAEVIDHVKSRTSLDPKTLVLSQANDVLIPSSGETQIDIARAACVLQAGVALSGDLNIIRSSLNGVFLSFYLNHRKKQEIAKMAQGISVVHLYNSQLQELEIEIPCAEEQRKIVQFLTSLDWSSENLNQQITHTQTWKKGLLQKMFV